MTFRLSQSDSTPEPATPVSARPTPIDLGSGITLLDYRVHRGSGYPGVLAELRNDSSETVDSPVVSVSYATKDGSDGFTWLSPVIPIIEPGASIPLWGIIPSPEKSIGAALESATFALCTDVAPGPYTQQSATLNLKIETVAEYHEESRYLRQVNITNTGSVAIRNLFVRGFLRESNGRLAGFANTVSISTLWNGSQRSRQVNVNAYGGEELTSPVNPFEIIRGTDYTGEIVVGVAGPATAPGCSFGLPWET